MTEINRAVLVARPGEPFLEWARALDAESANLTLDDLRTDCSAYLVPEVCRDSDQEAILREYFTIIFEEQLESWHTEPTDWPQERDFDTFQKWFDVEFHTVVFDLCETPVEYLDDDEPQDQPSRDDG